MIQHDKVRAREAVQFLVDSSYFKHHLKKLRSTVVKPRALPFKGEAEVLNELLVIGRQSLEAMENLIEVVEIKRGDTDRGSYQREFMRAKRARDRKVLQLEALLLGAKPTSLAQAKEILTRQYEIWDKEKTSYLATVGDVDWETRNAHIKEFWRVKDDELEQLIVEARAQQQKTVTRKRVVSVAPPRVTNMGAALQEALDARIPRKRGTIRVDK